MTFKVGDKIRCMRAASLLGARTSLVLFEVYTVKAVLVIFEVYTVKAVQHDFIVLDNTPGLWHTDRFAPTVKVKDPPKSGRLMV